MAKKDRKDGKGKADEVSAADVDSAAPVESTGGAAVEAAGGDAADGPHTTDTGKLKRKYYEAELLRLQEELVKLQYLSLIHI